MLGGRMGLGYWIGVCPKRGMDHAVVFDEPMMEIVCPHCFRAGDGELRCEIVQVVRADSRPRFTRGQSAALAACAKRNLRGLRERARAASAGHGPRPAELVGASARAGVANLAGAVRELLEARGEPAQEADLVLLADVAELLDEAGA